MGIQDYVSEEIEDRRKDELTCFRMWRALSMGMAKETPLVMALIHETPITSPFIFTRGPPELPVFIAASVWM